MIPPARAFRSSLPFFIQDKHNLFKSNTTMEKKTTFLHTAFVLLLAVCLASCSSDESKFPAIQPNLPGNGQTFVKKIVHSGNIQGCYDWEFIYNDTRLFKAVGTLYNPKNISVQYTSQLTYAHDSVSIRNSGTLPMSVILNADNLVERLFVNKDEYRFVYEDRRLVSWQKTIKDYNFGADAMHARGVIEYKDGDIACVTYYENNDAPIYYRCTPSAFYNTTGLFPETLSKQMGCFGFEHLYYAGLMGRGTKHLVQTILVDYADEAREEDYRIDFSYSTNKEDHVQLCTFILDGEAVSVNYGY